MSISCDCSVDGYDYPEFYSEEFPTARKTYKCCECHQDIKPGQKYHRAHGKWDGRWETYRTCMPCYNIREHYCPGGYIFTMLRDTIRECLDFDYLRIPDEEE